MRKQYFQIVRVLTKSGESHIYPTARVLGVVGDGVTVRYMADTGLTTAFHSGVRKIWQGRI